MQRSDCRPLHGRRRHALFEGGGVAANQGTAGFNAVGFSNPYAGDNTDQPLNTTLLGGTGFAGFGKVTPPTLVQVMVSVSMQTAAMVSGRLTEARRLVPPIVQMT